MLSSVSANQAAFEQRQLTEKQAKQWLKAREKTVKAWIYLAAIAGVINGLLLMLQLAVFAFILQQLLIERQHLFAHLDALNFDYSQIFSGLFQVYPLLNPAQNYLIPAMGLWLIAVILRSIMIYLSQTLGFEAAAIIKTDLREQLLSRLPKIESAYFKQHSAGELTATILEQVEALEPYFSRYCPQQKLISLLPLLMIIAIWSINWLVAVILMIAMPLLIIFMALIGISAAATSRHQFLTLTRMSGYFLDRLQGLTTLKLFGQAQRELLTITQVANDFRLSTMNVLRIAFLSSTVLEFFSAIAIALIAVYVSLTLLGLIHIGPENPLNLQQSLFLLLLAPEFFNPLRQLAVFYHDRASALGAANLLIQLSQAPILTWSTTPLIHETNYCLELNQVSKSYHQRFILREVELQIKAGEKVVLIGDSGAGKSTLLRLFLGLETADQGQVFINGQSVNSTIASEQIAWIGQQATIFYGSISDNISLFNSHYSSDELLTAAKAAGVTEFSDGLTKGLNTLIGERGYGLSGGQVQRIALARAFLKNAPIILLDEPTAHLDQETKNQLLNTIEQLFKDKTVIIASHDPEVIARIPRKMTLQNAQLI